MKKDYAVYAYYPLITQRIVEQSAKRTRRADYLEIGTQEGGSLNAALQSHVVGLAIGVDTWGGEYGGTGRGSTAHILERFDEVAMRRVILLTGDSAKIIPTITHTFDVIFVDGDHSEYGCLSDMANCWSLLIAGGTMLVDDTDHPEHKHIRDLTARFAQRHGAKIEYHNLQFGVAEITKP